MSHVFIVRTILGFKIAIQPTQQNRTAFRHSWIMVKWKELLWELKESLKPCESTKRVFIKLIDYVIYWILMHLHEAWKLIRLESVRRFIRSFYFNVQKQVKINHSYALMNIYYFIYDPNWILKSHLRQWLNACARIHQTERIEMVKHFFNINSIKSIFGFESISFRWTLNSQNG